MPTDNNVWSALKTLSGPDLKKATFKTIQNLSLAIQSSSIDDPSILEAVPRLSALIDCHPEELGGFRELVSSLARSTGLWNYIDVELADASDAIVAEAVTAPELGGVTFHREQINALNVLLSGRNLILSAPTSFGKSILIDALLATGRYKRVAIVLPTIALLDEFRRRFQARFSGKFDLVMHASEEASDRPTIFLGTQERLIYREDLGYLDLTVIDEFYKLDPARHDERSVTLNAAAYRLLKRSKQFFFLGPNIDKVSISADARWNFEFLRTRFSTVAVDTLDLQGVEDKRERLIEEIGEDKNWPALVFISSPDRANKLAIELSDRMAVSEEAGEFSAWLKENVGSKNFLSNAVYYGFGVHHGRIPRAVAARMVKLFNDKQLPVLLCTSTLIEGVNTAAKTVMIFDKKINRDDYDFFTFSNIRGRAGRLGMHHVGQVMLFNDVPEFSELEVNPTMFSEDDALPDEYVVHIDKPDRSRRSDSRLNFYQERLGLEGPDLRLASSIGFDVAVNLKEEVAKSLGRSSRLIFAGWPSWNEVLELCEVLCTQQSASKFGAFNAKQLATIINKLRKASTLRDFLRQQDTTYIGRPEACDIVFKFLRACEYGLPQHFSVMGLFVRQISGEGDYSLFVSGLSSWFRPLVLKELDEEGIPIQISEPFFVSGDTKVSLKRRLEKLSQDNSSSLTKFEKEWIRDVL